MKKSAWIPLACLAASLLVTQRAGATELIYGFDDPSINGFTGNSATASYNTTTGVTEGVGAMEIDNSSRQTYGGAVTGIVPADLYNATSFNIDVTIPTAVTSTYFDLVPIFYETANNGTSYEIDPDTSTYPDSFINLGGVAAGTYTYTINLTHFYGNDPNNPSTADATPGAILASDQVADDAAGKTMTDAITGFQLTEEHGGTVATSLIVDNVTVPSVPEPASIGALAVGALIVARRRRA